MNRISNLTQTTPPSSPKSSAPKQKTETAEVRGGSVPALRLSSRSPRIAELARAYESENSPLASPDATALVEAEDVTMGQVEVVTIETVQYAELRAGALVIKDSPQTRASAQTGLARKKHARNLSDWAGGKSDGGVAKAIERDGEKGLETPALDSSGPAQELTQLAPQRWNSERKRRTVNFALPPNLSQRDVSSSPSGDDREITLEEFLPTLSGSPSKASQERSHEPRFPGRSSTVKSTRRSANLAPRSLAARHALVPAQKPQGDELTCEEFLKELEGSPHKQ